MKNDKKNVMAMILGIVMFVIIILIILYFNIIVHKSSVESEIKKDYNITEEKLEDGGTYYLIEKTEEIMPGVKVENVSVNYRNGTSLIEATVRNEKDTLLPDTNLELYFYKGEDVIQIVSGFIPETESQGTSIVQCMLNSELKGATDVKIEVVE